MYFPLHLRWASAAAVTALIVSHAPISAAPDRCEQTLSRSATDLPMQRAPRVPILPPPIRRRPPPTTRLPALPPRAFTPQNDRDTIAPDPDHRPPITGPVPGIQINARIAGDPQGQARVLIRSARQLERQARGGRRSRYAQRIQQRFCLERLRRAEGLRLRLAKQGHPQSTVSNAADPTACRPNPSSTDFDSISMTTIQACRSRAGLTSWRRQPSSGVPQSR